MVPEGATEVEPEAATYPTLLMYIEVSALAEDHESVAEEPYGIGFWLKTMLQEAGVWDPETVTPAVDVCPPTVTLAV